MIKRALLIGSQTDGLTGVDTDVACIADALSPFGFEADICIGNDATRAGILSRYKQLIQNTAAGDAVVVYYSGHGGLAANPEYHPMTAATTPIPRYYQFIVPVDLHESSEDEFRGILSLELSALLTELTAQTTNVTVILDCCHAARMSRDLSLMPKALHRPWYVGIVAHLRRLKATGYFFDGQYVEGNPYAVRLVAAGLNQSAYEYTNEDNKRIGILTESFTLAVREAKGLPITWDAIGKRVRERVLSFVPSQRPEVEGPVGRLLFRLEEPDRTGVLSYFLDGNRPSLRGGRILGVEVGDEFSIVPMAAEKADTQSEIARATVTEVAGAISRVRLAVRGDQEDVPDGARAVPIRAAFRKRKVTVEAIGEEGDALIGAINASDHTKVAEAGDLEDILASVRLLNRRIELRDTTGSLIVFPVPFTPGAVQKTVENLRLLARARAIQELTSGTGPNRLTVSYELEWGRIRNGTPRRLARSGTLVFTGDRIYVRVHNRGEEPIYVSVFDVGVGGKITLLTTSEPSGIELNPGEDYVLGYVEHGSLRGLTLSWPDSVPDDGPRLESLVIVICDEPQDLRALETIGARRTRVPGGSSLQQLLEQIQWGESRDLLPSRAEAKDVRYAIEHIDFLLHPSTIRVDDDEQFLIDERPEVTFLAFLPRAVGQLPSKVAIRLTQLVVHKNRAVFGADIRMDTMTVTNRSTQSDADFYQVETMRFSGVKDGDRLSFDNLLVYYGPVEGYLDFAVWISRDRAGSVKLADMLRTQLNSEEFKEAALTLTTLAVTAPQAAAVVGAAGAAATLVKIAYELLSEAVGKSIGLYRTSLLAHEGFGVGKHPPRGLMRAQDFSFGYEIIAVE